MHTSLVPEPIKLTYQDFCALPDDGRRYEILDGDLYMSPSPGLVHQTVLGNLLFTLYEHVRERRLGTLLPGPIDVLLSEYDIVVPDILFVGALRTALIEKKYIKGPPDLLVEICSDATRQRDIRAKRNLYARCAVPWYWIIDPEGPRVMELQLVDRAYAVVAEPSGDASWTPKLFPELTVTLPDLIRP